MDIIRVGIIGCGGIAGMHADVLESLKEEGIQVTAVCDIRPERANKFAERFGAAAYTDYVEMLHTAPIDAVHITSPNYLHASMTIEALKAGKYVLCEKPMAINVEDGKKMIEADKEAGGNKLCIVFQNRYNPANRRFKEIVDNGTLGKLKALRANVAWKREMDYYSDDWHGRIRFEGGGVMMTQAIHTLDFVQYLAGGAYSVMGECGTHKLQGQIEVEDTANAYIRMKNGSTAIMYATVDYAIDSPIEVEGVFEKGILLLKGTSLFRWEDNNLVSIVSPVSESTGHKDYWGSGHGMQIRDFYASIREKRPFFIDGEQGLEAIKLIRGIYDSSESGKEVVI